MCRTPGSGCPKDDKANQAVKHDQGKPRPDLVLGDFMPALMHVVFVGTFGCYKYAPRNFQGLEAGEERYAEATFRHYMDRKAKGELFDRETGEYHLAHEIWDKIAELYFFLKEHAGVEYEARIYADAPQGRTYWTPGGEWVDDGVDAWLDEDTARQAVWALQSEGCRNARVEKRERQGFLEAIAEGEELAALEAIDEGLKEWGVWNPRTRLWLRLNGAGLWAYDVSEAWKTTDADYAWRTAGEMVAEARRPHAWGIRYTRKGYWYVDTAVPQPDPRHATVWPTEDEAATVWSDLDPTIREHTRVEPLP